MTVPIATNITDLRLHVLMLKVIIVSCCLKRYTVITMSKNTRTCVIFLVLHRESFITTKYLTTTKCDSPEIIYNVGT